MTLFEPGQKVLAIGSHPDDIEYSCAGTLLKLQEEYDSVIKCFVMSCGSKGDPTSNINRINESKNALKIFGNPENNIFNTRTYPCNPDINQESSLLRNIILEFQPDIIFTHSSCDTHQEHIVTNQITLTAARRIKLSLLEYPVLSATPSYKPNIYSDISNYYSRKMEILSNHKSQSKKSYMQEDFLKVFHQSAYAMIHYCNLVETFSIHRLIIN
mgnify:CR=1 FL=1